MGVYQIRQECRMCLSCMQRCPTRAITPGDGTLRIEAGRCVGCGECLRSCVHGGVALEDQTDRVRGFLRAGRRVILSLDPACRGLLPPDVTLEKLAAAAQRLGIWETADASEAAAAVASEYARLLDSGRTDRVILAHCPVVRNLVEQYHPALLGLLAPVASPMTAHGRMLKKDFTSAAVVYVAVCGAQIQDAMDVRHSTEVNAVLTLPQLLAWMEREGVNPAQCEEEPLLSGQGGVGMLTAVAGGFQTGVEYYLPDHGYSWLSADGTDRCMALLDALEKGELGRCVLELSACAGGCLGGPAGGLPLSEQPGARRTLARQLDREGREPYFSTQGIAMANPAIDRSAGEYAPDEAQVQEMLYRIGVGNPRQQQNCGACGYATCRERAEAILSHRENVSLCRRVVQEARRDVYSALYEALPMAAVLVDENQRVAALNQEARSLFSVPPGDGRERYIFELMDPGDFQYVLDTGLPIKNRRMDIPEIFMRVEADLVPLKGQGMVLGLFRDITEEEEEEARLQSSRLQSVEMAQKVIEKQMTVAQQIAFLLGETTAETKVTLNQLKQRILGEEEQP